MNKFIDSLSNYVQISSKDSLYWLSILFSLSISESACGWFVEDKQCEHNGLHIIVDDGLNAVIHNSKVSLVPDCFQRKTFNTMMQGYGAPV